MLAEVWSEPSIQLVLGLLAFPLWSSVFVVAADRKVPQNVLAATVVVAMASLIIICIFGSLRLMGVLSDDVWALTGTGLRAIVDVAALACLVASLR